MHLKNSRWFYATLTVLTLSLTAFAEPVRDNDSDEPDPQEEVMPVMPVMPEGTAGAPNALSPKWTATDFSGQTQALGWTSDAFRVPSGMEDRVQFWKDVYTKYTSDQGLLHDSKYVNLVYDSLDFTDITTNPELTDRQREKARRKRVTDHKREVVARLTRLQSLKSGDGLEGEDRRYWDMFAKIDEPKKFVEAGRRKRLRFQLGQRNQTMAGVVQSGRYLRQIEEIFRQEGLPLELTRLPFVESSFNLRARSRVGASGLWQFMRSAARPYMRMDNAADERNDPLSATRAAAKKLRDNFQMLKSWPLAITAYNHGPSGVRRLTEKMGTTDIVELIDVRKGRFGFASANFFASFLAALDVERRADQHFGVLEIMPELRGAEVQLVKNQSSAEILKWFSGDVELAHQLNPHITEAVWSGRTPLTRKHILRVPLLQEKQAKNALQ